MLEVIHRKTDSLRPPTPDTPNALDTAINGEPGYPPAYMVAEASPAVETVREMGSMRRFCVNALTKAIPGALAEKSAGIAAKKVKENELEAKHRRSLPATQRQSDRRGKGAIVPREVRPNKPISNRQARRMHYATYKASEKKLKQEETALNLRILEGGFGLHNEDDDPHLGRLEERKRDYTIRVDGLSEVVDLGKSSAKEDEKLAESYVLSWLEKAKEKQGHTPGTEISNLHYSMIEGVDELYGTGHGMDFQAKLKAGLEWTDKRNLSEELSQLNGLTEGPMKISSKTFIALAESLDEPSDDFRKRLRSLIGPDRYQKVESPTNAGDKGRKYHLTLNEQAFGVILAEAKEKRGESFIRGWLTDAQRELSDEGQKDIITSVLDKLSEFDNAHPKIPFENKIRLAMQSVGRDDVVKTLNGLRPVIMPPNPAFHKNPKNIKPTGVGKIFEHFTDLPRADSARFLRSIEKDLGDGDRLSVPKMVKAYVEEYYPDMNLLQRPTDYLERLEASGLSKIEVKKRKTALNEYYLIKGLHVDEPEKEFDKMERGIDRKGLRYNKNIRAYQRLAPDLRHKADEYRDRREAIVDNARYFRDSAKIRTAKSFDDFKKGRLRIPRIHNLDLTSSRGKRKSP